MNRKQNGSESKSGAHILTDIAFVFAGQGSQYPGMGQDICANSPAARAVFAAADKVKSDTSHICFEGNAEELKQTSNTQPCMLAVDLACAEAMREQGIEPAVVAGFSLGEIGALAFAGAYSTMQAFEIVNDRARFMDEATMSAPGAMAAIVGPTTSHCTQLIEQYARIVIANYNNPMQHVVSGPASDVDALCAELKQQKVRAIPLSVSGAFHSSLMSSARDAFLTTLAAHSFSTPQIPVYANLTAQPYDGSAETMKSQLADQISHPVQWTTTVQNMIAAGTTTFVEVGPGKVLCGLIKKIDSSVVTYNVETYEQAQNVALKLTEGVGI